MKSDLHIWDLAGELAEEITPLYPADGLHGLMHPLRLMGMVADFCQTYRLPAEDFLLAAAYHDAGRTHDDEDELHGARSARILLSHRPKASALCLDLVVNHCRPPRHSRFPEELAYFKDLDAIDRQRFGETNILTSKITNDMPHWLEVNRTILRCESWSEICRAL